MGIDGRTGDRASTDAVVRMDTTTICGTDLLILKGDVPEGISDEQVLFLSDFLSRGSAYVSGTISVLLLLLYSRNRRCLSPTLPRIRAMSP